MANSVTKRELNIADENDFIMFFFEKIFPKNQPVLSKLTYKCKQPGVDELFRMLENVYLKYELTDVRALWRVFYSLENSLETLHESSAQSSGSNVRVSSFENTRLAACSHPYSEYIFTKTYDEIQEFIDPSQDLARLACMSGNIGLFAELLKFGAIIGKPWDTQEERNVMKHRFSLECIWKHPGLSEPLLAKNLYWNFTPAARSRLYIVGLGLEFMFKIEAEPEYAQSYKQCYQLLFKAIREPKIRISEVKYCLTKLLSLKSQVNWPTENILVRDLAKRYQVCFPKSVRPATPRSLKHLSRCQVRENLRGTGNFIGNLFNLKLPQRIKQYITLNVAEKKFPVFCVRKKLTLCVGSEVDFAFGFLPELVENQTLQIE